MPFIDHWVKIPLRPFTPSGQKIRLKKLEVEESLALYRHAMTSYYQIRAMGVAERMVKIAHSITQTHKNQYEKSCAELDLLIESSNSRKGL